MFRQGEGGRGVDGGEGGVNEGRVVEGGNTAAIGKVFACSTLGRNHTG